MRRERSALLASSTLLFCLAGAALPAQAYEAGDLIVRAGAAVVDPRDSSGAIAVAGLGTLSGTGAGVDSGSALGLALTYMVTPHWGIELLAATPFEHDIAAQGLGIDRLGSTRHLPPTLSLQYYFADPGSRLQPYVGLGINYTVFFEEESSSAARTALDARNLELDESFGLAAQLGIDLQLNERWLLNAAVWRIDIDTTATVDTALGRAKVNADLDPWVYMVGFGYRF